MRRDMGDVGAVIEDFAGLGAGPAEHAHHQGRFAGAIGADQRDDFAVVDIEIDALERDDLAVGRAQAADRQQRRAHASASSTAATVASSSTPR